MGDLIGSVALSNLKVRKTALKTLELVALRLDYLSPALYDKFVVKLLAGLLSSAASMQAATILVLTFFVV